MAVPQEAPRPSLPEQEEAGRIIEFPAVSLDVSPQIALPQSRDLPSDSAIQQEAIVMSSGGVLPRQPDGRPTVWPPPGYRR